MHPTPAQQLEARAAAIEAHEHTASTKQRAKGRRSARERIEALLDEGSFVELDAFVEHNCHDFGMASKALPGDGVITGYGTIDGRRVCVYSQDFTAFGGSLGEAHGQKITKVMDLAVRTGVPMIGLNDGGGARIQEGIGALTQFAEIFRRNVAASGVIPQISVILGPCAGGAVYSPALTDFTVMVEGTSQMFITGPEVIRAVTGEDVGLEELGGARAHAQRSGVAHYAAHDEDDAFEYVRELLSYLPENTLSEPPLTEPDEPGEVDLDTLVPASASQPYDMTQVLEAIADGGSFLEVMPAYAGNVITAFARVDGRSVGIAANQPMVMAGALDIAASEKAARFVRLCDAFNLPVLTFVDVPGFLPGTSQEWDGIIRRGAKLIYAYAEATVPLITTITRKAYGGAYIVMGSKKLGADINLAWPTAQVAVMGAAGAVNILHRRELATLSADDAAARRTELIEAYEEKLVSPWEAARRGFVDAVIKPSQTRAQLVAALRALETKRVASPVRRHGNIPL